MNSTKRKQTCQKDFHPPEGCKCNHRERRLWRKSCLFRREKMITTWARGYLRTYTKSVELRMSNWTQPSLLSLSPRSQELRPWGTSRICLLTLEWWMTLSTGILFISRSMELRPPWCKLFQRTRDGLPLMPRSLIERDQSKKASWEMLRKSTLCLQIGCKFNMKSPDQILCKDLAQSMA